MRTDNISQLANKYLTGLKGVEIGGSAQKDFMLDTINVDREDNPESAKRSIQYGYDPMKIDVFADGADLPFEDNEYDFVIASHVIEHFYDPIKALLEWHRVASKYIFIICPHKDRMFDRDKETTTLYELLLRHDTPVENEQHDHQSFWNTLAFIELCVYLEFDVVEFQDVDDRVGNGFSVVIKID